MVGGKNVFDIHATDATPMIYLLIIMHIYVNIIKYTQLLQYKFDFQFITYFADSVFGATK